METVLVAWFYNNSVDVFNDCRLASNFLCCHILFDPKFLRSLANINKDIVIVVFAYLDLIVVRHFSRINIFEFICSRDRFCRFHTS